MKLIKFTIPLAVSIALALSACAKEPEEPTITVSTNPIQAYADVQQKAKGFTVGSVASNNAVYVFFDPQCPHCGHLWQQSQPLLNKAKFVWIPVSIMGPKSLPQGAALLAATNPPELMTKHEASILAGTGGISASSSIPDEIEVAIKTNTKLFNRMGIESVPFIIGKNAQTGQVVKNPGAMEAAALASLFGITFN